MKEVNINFLQILLIVLEQKKKLLFHFFVISFFAVTISLLIPKTYKATTVFLPPDVGGGFSISALIPKFPVDLLGGNEVTKRQIKTLIESREIKEKIIQEFDLVRVYKTQNEQDFLERAIKGLEKNTIIDIKEEGGLGFVEVISLSLSVVDKDSVRSAKIANFYVSCLDDKIREINAIKPSANMNFIEKQMIKTRESLESARTELQGFQRDNKIFDIPEQVKYVLKSSALLRSQIIDLETRKSFLALQSTRQHPDILQLEGQIGILNKKVGEIESQRQPDLFLGLEKSIELAYHYADLFLEVETLTGVVMLLKQQNEQAKIQQAKEVGGIKIVDFAKTPQKKYKPKRAYVVLGIVGVYMGFLVLYIFLRHQYLRLKDSGSPLVKEVEILLSHLGLKK